jgi:hypothetical protein
MWFFCCLGGTQLQEMVFNSPMEREEADDEDVPLAVLKRQGQLRMDEVERAREQQSEDVGACVQISSRMFRNDDRFMVLEQVDPEGKVTLAWSRALQPGRGLVYFVSSMHLRPAVYVVNQAGVGGWMYVLILHSLSLCGSLCTSIRHSMYHVLCSCRRSMSARDAALKAKHEAMQSLVTESGRSWHRGFRVSEDEQSPRTLEYVNMPAVHVYVFE